MREIDLQQDYETLKEWYSAYAQVPPGPEYLSTTGLIIEGKCAVFLYITNSSVGYVERLIANPALDKEERKNAIHILCEALEPYGRDLGCKVLVTVINKNYVLDLSETLDYRLAPGQVLYKEIA